MSAGRRGQVLVLACASLLLLGLSMAFSFSLSNAIHERIRIQSQADAQAYSVATLEARGLNIMVYTNRTIASMVVTNMSVHAWHAIASETVSILSAAEAGMRQVAAKEDRCCEKFNAACCQDAKDAAAIADAFGAEAGKWDGLIQNSESAFNDTVRALNKAAASLHVLQKATLDRVATEISDANDGTLKVLRARNAPRSEYVPLVHGVNRREFACAVEGWTAHDDCQTLLGKTIPRHTPDERSVIFEDVSNAARGSFHLYCAKGACQQVGHADFQPGSSYLLGIMGGEGSVCLGFDGKAGVTELSHILPPKNTFKAESVGAETAGSLMVGWRHGNGSGSLGSTAFSDRAGGLHGPGHMNPHSRFRGIQEQEVCQGPEDSCFINFRGVDPSQQGKDRDGNEVGLSVEGDDRGLPSAWGAVQQDLGLMRSGRRGPWELNDEAKLHVNFGPGLRAAVPLAPGHGLAVAKAKVYFHELGAIVDGVEKAPAPNMFDPFFRAKLERFRCEELAEILSLSGDAEGAEMVRNRKSPVEGVRQTTTCGGGAP